MSPSIKETFDIKRVLLVFFVFSIIFISIIVILTYIFIRSSAFPDFVEQKLGELLDKDISIERLSVTGKPGVVFEQVVITERDSGRPFLILPHGELKFSIRNIFKGKIDDVILHQPEFLIPKVAEKGRKTTLPVTVKKGMIEDGRIIMPVDGEEYPVIGPVNLMLEEDASGKRALIRGEAKLPFLDRPVSFETGLDYENLILDQGHLDLDLLKIETNIRKSVFGSVVSLDIEFLRKNDFYEVKIQGNFQELSITTDKGAFFIQNSTAETKALLKISQDYEVAFMEAEALLRSPGWHPEGYLRTSFTAEYERAAQFLKIKEASFDSSIFGNLVFEGQTRGLFDAGADFYLDVQGENVSLEKVKQYILEPFQAARYLPVDYGRLDGSASIRGSITDKINWDTRIILSELPFETEGLTIFSRGSYDRYADFLNIDSLTARSASYQPLILRGSVREATSPDGIFDLNFEGRKIPLKEIRQLAGDILPTWLNSLDITGYGQVKGSIKGSRKSPLISGAVSLEGDQLHLDDFNLTSFKIEFSLGHSRGNHIINNINARSGIVKFAGWNDEKPVCNLKNTRIIMDKLGFINNGFEIWGGRILADTIVISGKEKTDPSYFLTDNELIIPHLNFLESIISVQGCLLTVNKAVISADKDKLFSEEKISLKADFESHLEKKTAELSSFTLNTEDLKAVKGNISYRWIEQPLIESTIEFPTLDLENIQMLFPNIFYGEKKYILRGKGTLRNTVSVSLPEGAPIHLSGETVLNLEEGAFSSPGVSRMGELENLNISANFDLTSHNGEISFSAEAEAGGFEILIGNFYGDFTERKLRLSTDGNYLPDSGYVDISGFSLDLTGILSLKLSGHIYNLKEGPGFDIVAGATVLSNSNLYDFLIRETFRERFPELAGLEVSGTSSLKFEADGNPKYFSIAGEIEVDDMDLVSNEKNFRVKNLDLDLPVLFSSGGKDLREKELSGSIKMETMSWGPMPVDSMEFRFAAGESSFYVGENIILPLFGGRIVIKDINFENILSPERSFSLSMLVEDIDLAKLSVAFNMPEFQGRLYGEIPEIKYQKNNMIGEGEILLELFEGEARVRELAVRNILGPVTSWHASIDLKGINLGQVTETFAFGKISGVLEGSIRNLAIVDGQAEHFIADIKTVKRKGVPQKISVEALEKISILGSGSAASILSRGIYQFFKEYRYEKMGFSGRLRNDNLELIGIDTVDGKSYLVKGGFFPPKADVISFTRNISFREMVNRLKRVHAIKEKEGVRIE